MNSTRIRCGSLHLYDKYKITSLSMPHPRYFYTDFSYFPCLKGIVHPSGRHIGPISSKTGFQPTAAFLSIPHTVFTPHNMEDFDDEHYANT